MVIAMEFERFCDSIVGYFNLGQAQMLATTSLYDDLELDSIQAMRLLIVLEEWADVLLPPPDIPTLFTLGDAFAYYQDLCEMSNAESDLI